MAVVPTSASLDHLVQSAFRSIRRALKHHMFKQVSKPASTFRLQARTNTIGNTDAEGGRGVVLGNNHLETISQLFDADGNGPRSGACLMSCSRNSKWWRDEAHGHC